MNNEYLIEFRQIGQIVKVTAVDPASQTEATIQGPASAGQALLARNAIRKLEYLLKKNRTEGESGS